MDFSKRNKVLFISCSTALVAIVAALVLVLYFTSREAKPKTNQDWLNDFKIALDLKDAREFETIEKVIEIWDGETKVAMYRQRYEVESLYISKATR